jgi:outer membrane protein assembly factor BamB
VRYLAAALVVCVATAGADARVDWPQFRGPGASGIADGSNLPLRWSPTENVAWTIEVPGRGWSSPIVLGDRVYLTSAISGRAFKAPSTGIYGNEYVAELQKQGLPMEEILKRVAARDLENPEESGEVSYVLLAVDAGTGKITWMKEAHRGLPPGGRHRKNTYASETPATDGQRLYVSFGGNVGLFSYTLDGKLLWTRTWPPQPIYLDFGTASSPVVHHGRVFVLHDNEGESFLAALDATTGRDIWRVKRTGNEGRASGWSTPFIWQHEGRTEVVTLGRGQVVSYDLEGRELWRLKGITQAQPTPVAADGLLYVATGSQGEAGRPLFAIRPGASGDISLAAGETSSAFVAWYQPRFSGYTPSPLAYRGRVWVVNNNGVLQVADAQTGVEIFKARVGGGGQTFSSSPLASDGRIYLLSEDGDTFVLKAGDSYDELAKNSLGEMSLATPAPSSDSLFIRTQTKLYRIRSQPAGASRGR